MACHCDDYSQRPSRPRPARHRARHADARRHGPQPPLVPRPRQRPRAVGVRRLDALAHGVRGGHRARPGRAGVAGPRLDLPLRRGRLAVAARPDRRPALRTAAPQPRPDRERQQRRRLHRGLAAALAPERGAAARPAPRGQGLGDAGDRLRRPQPVALHLAALLGGRRGQPVRPHRLARPLPRQARHRRQPAAGPLARLGPRARAGRVQGAGGGRLQPGVLLARLPRRVGRRRSARS